MNDPDAFPSIIILNHNGRHLLNDCLRSVLSQSIDRCEVLLVDNGSRDGSVQYVRREFGSVCVVEAGKNLGFAGGNNLGVRHAKGNLIVLLNNDTVVSPGWLRGLVDAVTPCDVAVASSLVKTRGIPARYYEKNGSLNFLGHNIMRVFEKPDNIFYAGGASLIYKKAILGIPFDEDYFAYAEDVYLSLRARFMGYRVVHTNASVVEHRGGGTAGTRESLKLPMLQERNRLLNMLLFFAPATIAKVIPFLIANLIAKSVAALVSRRYSLRATLWAYSWLLTHWSTILRKRKALRAAFLVRDDEVVSWMTGKVTQGESGLGRLLNRASVLYCRCVGLRTIEVSPRGTR